MSPQPATRPRRARPAGFARPPATAVLLALVALAACADQTTEPTWVGVETRIAETFPDVRSIDTAALSELMQDPTQTVVLIDVREPDEFAVSHLEGAVRATSIDQAAALVGDAPEGATIVAYCSVGYRSAGLVAELSEHGLAGVHNLEGSIFRWANEGRPLYRGELPVSQVHPFNESWGTLLQAERRAYSP